jgi:hypothetical protein
LRLVPKSGLRTWPAVSVAATGESPSIGSW